MRMGSRMMLMIAPMDWVIMVCTVRPVDCSSRSPGHGCEAADAEHAADAGVDNAALHGLRVVGLNGKIGRARPTDRTARTAPWQWPSARCRFRRRGWRPPEFFSPRLWESRALTPTPMPTATADQQVLDGEGQATAPVTALSRHLRNVDAVHHVVKRLHQHGYRPWAAPCWRSASRRA